MEPLESLPKIGAPATGALNAAGYTRLDQLADASRAELGALHGVGPKAIRILEESLEEHGLRLAD
jgi:predicted flap endonuclease-1-like 5' DNA nuclease